MKPTGVTCSSACLTITNVLPYATVAPISANSGSNGRRVRHAVGSVANDGD